MKKYIFMILFFLFYGCSSTSNNTTPIVSTYKPNGIKIKYLSSKDLNYFENESHTLLLVIYQLQDKNMFEELCNTQNGINVLLKGNLASKSVLGVNKKIIFPNTNGIITEDKLNNAKYIGIVAGFYKKPQCLLIPLKVKNKYFSSIKFWKPKKVVENLNAKIKLYRDNIQLIKDH
jgi:type VI secretion system VasD/TssJ family lipoprotein